MFGYKSLFTETKIKIFYNFVGLKPVKMKIKLFTIPNFITLGNLLCGAGSIVASLVYNDLTTAFVLVIVAAVFDFFDGFAARMLNQPSAIGVQLDSLADMVSFGTAPAAALFALYASAQSAFGWSWLDGGICRFLPFVITAFSALRLAKFNIDDSQHDEFSGLTTTANGIFCTSLAAVCAMGDWVMAREWILLIAAVVSALLVSPIRMFSFKFKAHAFGWKGNEVRYSFIIFAIVALSVLKIYAIPLIIVIYIAVSTLMWIFKRSK